MTRRSTHVDHEVVYAAVGASAAPDLLRFPPEGATPFADELRLGSGADRFLTASSLLMTWGAQRGTGITVADVVHGDGGHYTGVVFASDGTPEVAATADVQFGPDGEPYLTAGTTARLVWPGERLSRRIRIVYTIDEPRRVGFAWGSADGEGVIGEEAFVVEHRDDDSVWATVRGFLWAPAAGLLGLKGRAAIRLVMKEAAGQLTALAPGAAAVADATAADAVDAAGTKLEATESEFADPAEAEAETEDTDAVDGETAEADGDRVDAATSRADGTGTDDSGAEQPDGA